MRRWPTVMIGEVADPVDRSESPLPGVTYRQVGVRLWGQGAYERESMDGVETKYKSLNRVEAGDIIVNKIWARNGSVSVVTPELGGCFCSGEFPLFRPRSERLDPQWFYWITKTRWFWDACDRQSRGTSGKNRLRPQRFLEIAIPLAPIEEQRRIVEKLNRLAASITRLARVHVSVEFAETQLDIAVLRAVFDGKRPYGKVHFARSAGDVLAAQALKYRDREGSKHNRAHPHRPFVDDDSGSLPDGWARTTLGSALTHLVDCVNDTPDFSEVPTDCIGLKTTNIRPYRLDLSQRWFMTRDDFERWNRRETPLAGDIVFTREAPVGNACMLTSNVRACLTQRLMLFRADGEYVVPQYVLHFLNSPQFKTQVAEAARGLTTPHVNVKDAPDFVMPLPPLEEQVEIAAYLETRRGKTERACRLRESAIQETGALLTSMLSSLVSTVL